MSQIEKFPLCWPNGFERTPSGQRIDSPYSCGFTKALDNLEQELDRLGVWGSAVVSTNLPVRKNGQPYAENKLIDDPGVAVWFQRKKRLICVPVDSYRRVWENMQAIYYYLNSLRRAERDGIVQLVDKTFSAFAQLPPPTKGDVFTELFQLPLDAPLEQAEIAYRKIAKNYHPDVNRSSEAPEIMRQANEAIEERRKRAKNG